MDNSEDNHGIRVLIVEDDAYLNETLCEVLESEGYVVNGATNVLDALNELSNKKVRYGLLLLDYNLKNSKGTNGIDLFKAAKELCPGIKSVMMSAYGSRQVKEQALNSGIVAFIDKPFRFNELFNALNAISQ